MRCDCGAEKEVNGHELRRGTTKSCGCSAKEFVSLYWAKRREGRPAKEERIRKKPGRKLQDLTGRIFGWYEVIEEVKREIPGTWWLCRCRCGTERIIWSRDLKDGRRYSCGCAANGQPLLSDEERARKRLARLRRKELKRGQDSTLTTAQWLLLRSTTKRCYYCNKKFTKQRKLDGSLGPATHDHVIALSQGGRNTLSNSVCAHLQCNSRKGAGRINPMTGQGILH